MANRANNDLELEDLTPEQQRAEEIICRAFREGLRPDPDLSVSEFAEEHLILSGEAASEPGPMRFARTPYLREIVDSLSPDSDFERVVFMKGSQIGATTAGNCFLGFVIMHAPGPLLYVEPRETDAKRHSKQRIAPLIRSSPALSERVKDARSRDSGNTVLEKEFPGGILIVTGGNSAAGLRGLPMRYLFLDEVDAYPLDVDGEGDPIKLAERRAANYKSSRKIFVVSTPTIKGLSRIEKEFQRTDQRYYEVPCPHCGSYQRIKWSQIIWPDGQPELAVMKCAECEEEIPEREKTWMLERGKWTASSEGVPGTVGYHLSALYSPVGWYSWGEAAQDFLDAKKAGAEELKVWINTVLGEVWEEYGETVAAETLLERREKWSAEIPADALLLTAGVDVQADRIEMEVVGWGEGEESWSVDYRILWGATDRGDVWTALSDALEKTYTHQLGDRLHILHACIDSGYATHTVYGFCKQRRGRGVFATKGEEGDARPVVQAPRRRRTGRKQRPVELYIIGTYEAKGIIYSRLRITEPGPGCCHFPRDDAHDAEFFAQLTAEKRITRYKRGRPYRVWEQTRPRNEVLDCRVGALAAVRILNPDFEIIRKRRDRARERKRSGGPPRKRRVMRSSLMNRG